MSTGTQILLGVVAALVLALLFVLRGRRAPVEPRPVTGDLDDRLRALIADGRPVPAVRELRQETGMGLLEAKRYVDALTATGEPPVAREVSAATMTRARELKAAGRVVLAVKAVRAETGWGLQRCKDIVDGLPGG